MSAAAKILIKPKTCAYQNDKTFSVFRKGQLTDKRPPKVLYCVQLFGTTCTHYVPQRKGSLLGLVLLVSHFPFGGVTFTIVLRNENVIFFSFLQLKLWTSNEKEYFVHSARHSAVCTATYKLRVHEPLTALWLENSGIAFRREDINYSALGFNRITPTFRTETTTEPINRPRRPPFKNIPIHHQYLSSSFIRQSDISEKPNIQDTYSIGVRFGPRPRYRVTSFDAKQNLKGKIHSGISVKYGSLMKCHALKVLSANR